MFEYLSIKFKNHGLLRLQNEEGMGALIAGLDWTGFVLRSGSLTEMLKGITYMTLNYFSFGAESTPSNIVSLSCFFVKF